MESYGLVGCIKQSTCGLFNKLQLNKPEVRIQIFPIHMTNNTRLNYSVDACVHKTMEDHIESLFLFLKKIKPSPS